MKKLDRFILREILSDGPAGTVYRADEVLPGDNRRSVALKVLSPVPEGSVTGETDIEKRFFSEVKVLAQLAVHPHVVTLYAMGLTDGYPWLAMEYSAGTMTQKLSDNPADAAQVMRLLEQVARGLSAMHSLKPPLIHQDIKPSNILLDALGNYKITDFSLASVHAAGRTQPVATVRYAAPEMLSADFGRVGPATDLYALGHVAYELALGDRLHRQQFPAVFEGNTSKDPAPNKWMMWHASIGMKPAPAAEVVRGFPAALSEVMARLMAKPLPQRYATADELLSDLSVVRSEIEQSAMSPAHVAASSAGTAPVAEQQRRGRSEKSAAPTVPQTSPVIGSPDVTSPTSPRPGSPAPALPASSPAPAAAPASASSGPRYFVRLRGKVTGPFDLPTLQRQLKQGQLSRLHQVSNDQVTWKQASDIEGLYGPTVV